MNLQENIQRIKQMMGIITEQSNQLPYIVKGSHIGKDCDSLHGFQLKKNNADMNGIVKTALDEFKNQGVGVWVSDVRVEVKGMNVNWEVTIDKSSDGEFWNGFTSRGAGCNSNIQTRWNSELVGNGKNSITDKITGSNICNNVTEIQLVKKAEFTNLGDNSFIQGFYRYKCSGESGKVHKVEGTSLDDLRTQLKIYTLNKGFKIDKETITVDMDNYSVSFEEGEIPIISLSLIFDQDKDTLNTRWDDIKVKNSTMELQKEGKKGNFFWRLSTI